MKVKDKFYWWRGVEAPQDIVSNMEFENK